VVATAKLEKTFPVFDADSHVLEPQSLWTEHLEPEYRILARSWFWYEDGEFGPHTILNGKAAPELPTANIPRHAVWHPGMTDEDMGGLDPKERHPVNPGASDPRARLQDMDAMGVDQALLFPTIFAEYFPLMTNPDVAHALARAYNDWIMGFSKAAPERLIPLAVLPMQDVTFAVQELRRVAANGFRAATIRPVYSGGHYPSDRYYHPLWEALERTGVAACIHPSTGPATPEMDSNSGFVERVSANLDLGHPVAEFVAPAMDNATLLVGMMFDGLLERFPGLKLQFAHSGTPWLHTALDKAEGYLWVTEQEEPVSLDPAAVFHNRATLVTFSSGDGTIRRLSSLFERTGAWGSRYPNHDTLTASEAIADLRRGGVPEPTIEMLMGGNLGRVLGVETLSKQR
jgi:predicted TIM-barrel fold metal-dependent hydrolase